jgi:ATP-dependent DNA helicase RecQ
VTATQPEVFASRAQTALHEAFGPEARFRAGQLEAIRALVVDRARLLVVQRTGWGKSLVYFVATKLLRAESGGPTVIISPLLALMRDQQAMATRLGLRAATLNSSNQDEWESVEARLLADDVDVLLISPERLNNARFREQLLVPLTSRTGLFVVDEAHCISDWGHDFRPDYRRITRVLSLLPAGAPVLCTTATANDRVIADIIAQLGDGVQISRGPLDRESLALAAARLNTAAERLAWLAEWIPTREGTGIVYALTVGDATRVSDWLRSRGINAIAYSGGDSSETRLEVEDALRSNAVKVVCATSALGMGFDKPDVSFVVHYQSPDSPVAYYQQVGRAGRSVEHADGVLLAGTEDSDIWDWFIRSSLPVVDEASAVVDHLAQTQDWTPLSALESHFNLSQGRLTGLLKVLEVEGAVEAEGLRYRRTLASWTFDAERIDRVRAARLAEQQAMRDYAETSGCRMRFLREQLDDPDARDCGRCDNCREAPIAAASSQTIIEAIEFVRRRPAIIEPRKKWTLPRSGLIARDHQLEQGRTLGELSDAGYGRAVLQAKHENSLIPDDVVAAAADLIRGWLPDFDGTVVPVPTADPARALVPDFAMRLAACLGLPFREWVTKAHRTRPQKLMNNSAQQLGNVADAYLVTETDLAGPVLLVDDVSDSRWTMTVIADLLADAGVRGIYPFAIARTKG